MTIDPKALLAHPFEEMRQNVTERDTILYALGVGLGTDPTDARDLDYLIETRLKVLPTFGLPDRSGLATCKFPLFNTGRNATAGTHPEDVSKYTAGDVYRVSATVDGRGWTVAVPNALATANFGQYVQVPVHAKKTGSGPIVTQVKLTATSESDPAKKATASCTVIGR